jgi:hypothetical protein
MHGSFFWKILTQLWYCGNAFRRIRIWKIAGVGVDLVYVGDRTWGKWRAGDKKLHECVPRTLNEETSLSVIAVLTSRILSPGVLYSHRPTRSPRLLRPDTVVRDRNGLIKPDAVSRAILQCSPLSHVDRLCPIKASNALPVKMTQPQRNYCSCMYFGGGGITKSDQEKKARPQNPASSISYTDWKVVFTQAAMGAVSPCSVLVATLTILSPFCATALSPMISVWRTFEIQF